MARPQQVETLAPADAAALGQALWRSLVASHGAYVLIRTGHRRDREHPCAPGTPEFRVNLRQPDGTDITSYGASVLAALERAVSRLRARG